mmetsp:Transcript_6450/g.40304  ORF Transcript_6450/g.40304 Transcript_6450/m.40304 type:complete len:356 (+) Transcript_6450:586-1653(+)
MNQLGFCMVPPGQHQFAGGGSRGHNSLFGLVVGSDHRFFVPSFACHGFVRFPGVPNSHAAIFVGAQQPALRDVAVVGTFHPLQAHAHPCTAIGTAAPTVEAACFDPSVEIPHVYGAGDFPWPCDVDVSFPAARRKLAETTSSAQSTVVDPFQRLVRPPSPHVDRSPPPLADPRLARRASDLEHAFLRVASAARTRQSASWRRSVVPRGRVRARFRVQHSSRAHAPHRDVALLVARNEEASRRIEAGALHGCVASTQHVRRCATADVHRRRRALRCRWTRCGSCPHAPPADDVCVRCWKTKKTQTRSSGRKSSSKKKPKTWNTTRSARWTKTSSTRTSQTPAKTKMKTIGTDRKTI